MPGLKKANRSAYLNFLLARCEMYKGAVTVRSRPYYISIEPSDRCQLRCTTCPTGMENESRRSKAAERTIFRSQRSVLNSELFDSVLEELGEYLFRILFYNYGEPLLNKKLPTFIRKATALDIETEIHTNLSLPLSDEFIEELLGSGLGILQASIDGFSQETYEVHRVGGNFELVKRNLERLVKARDQLGLETDISYNFLVFSHNEHEIPAAESYCQDIGVPFNARDAFVDDPDWLPSYRKGEAPWQVPVEARLKDDVALGWSPALEVEESTCSSSCAWHYGFSVITAGGPVAPCCPVVKEKDDFGTVTPGETTFADVWNNDLYRKSRAVFANKEIPELDGVDTVCLRCPYPKSIQHLYSVHDFKVLKQFRNVFKGSDVSLEKAFNLFCTARYCLSLDELCEASFPPLEVLLTGRETRKDTAAFVEYVEKSVIGSV